MSKSCASCANKKCGNAGSEKGVPCGNWTRHKPKLTGRQVLNRIEKATLTMDVPSIRRVVKELRREVK